MPDGHPDLQGMYDLATLTPVERPTGTPLVLTDEEAAKLEKEVAQRKSRRRTRRSTRDRAAPPNGGDGSAGAAGNVGGYNNFWIDSGSRYTVIDGQRRASIVIDPPDGRVPALTPEARAAARPSRNVAADLGSVAREDDPGFEGAGAYDDPERRPLGERCLLGFGSTSGPPVLPNYFYNNLHQIVQTPDSVLILTEMVHDARVVRMNGEHAAEDDPEVDGRFDRPLGRRHAGRRHDELHRQDAVSRLHARTCTSSSGSRGVDAKTLLYRFTIEDPNTWDASRGRASTRGRRPTSACTNTRATKATTRWATSCAARGWRKRTSEENEGAVR